jgi:hypothetical protein
LNANRIQLKEAAVLIGAAVFDEALRKFLPGDLNGLRPCFSAIAHGCASGRHQEAYSEVYLPRAMRGSAAFLVHKLGALNANLAMLASFFETPWDSPSASLCGRAEDGVLQAAAYSLRALGRLREATKTYQAALKIVVGRHDGRNSAIGYGIISELRLSLGDVAEAIDAARIGVAQADERGDADWRMISRTILAACRT